MKKIETFIITALALITASSCDTLDIENIYNYDSNLVWEDQNLVNAFLADLYNDIYGTPSSTWDAKSAQTTGIYWYADRITITNSEEKFWPYTNIRKINEGLKQLETSELTASFKNNVKGQLLFLRAHLYSQAVFLHGGVPYVTVPQDRDADDLYVKRNSTAECFDFILKDLNDAISLLPEHIPSSSADFGKVSGAYAMAYKAKVLLWKASPLFHPNNPYSNSDWNAAFEACKTAYERLSALGYALEPEFSNIWTNEGGPETVFSVIAIYPNKTFDLIAWGARPGSESRSQASCGVTWDYIKAFPMKDGKVWNESSYGFKTEQEFAQKYWENRDDRFYATVIWNGSLYEVGGKTGNRQYMALGLCNVLDDFGTNPNAHLNSTNLDRYTGFYSRKFDDLSLSQATCLQYDLDYIVMRFAEVILNYAEAANEIGNASVALEMLKKIRSRAGIEPGADGTYGIGAPTREEMRNLILAERNVEFGLEGTQYNEIRRSRRFDLLDQSTLHGLEAIAINPDGSEMDMVEALEKVNREELTEKDFKYIIWQVPFNGVKINQVPDKYYFSPISQGVIDRSVPPGQTQSVLEQNNNWGGTFNPALE
jgi:hypothetical protein